MTLAFALLSRGFSLNKTFTCPFLQCVVSPKPRKALQARYRSHGDDLGALDWQNLKEESMGLDNYPRTYPCVTQGTAVQNPSPYDGSMAIDCAATHSCNGCPWKKDLGPKAVAIHGYFVKACGYRGEFGNRVLRTNLGITGCDIEGWTYDFFGDMEGQNYKTPESCLRLAAKIERVFKDQGLQSIEGFSSKSEAKSYVKYMIAWLRWVATKCDGSNAWF